MQALHIRGKSAKETRDLGGSCVGGRSTKPTRKSSMAQGMSAKRTNAASGELERGHPDKGCRLRPGWGVIGQHKCRARGKPKTD